MDENQDKIITELYNEYQGFVKRVCMAVIHNEAIASDCASDVWVQVVKYINQFRGEASIRSYLYRIAVNQCWMYMRKLQVRTEITTIDGEIPETVFYPEIDLGLLLKPAIASLPNGYKQCIELRYIQGLTSLEASKVLKTTHGTVKSQTFKALNRLQQIINGELTLVNGKIPRRESRPYKPRQSRQKIA